MIPAYPSPCESCTRKTCGNSDGIGCVAWRKRYQYRQKQINAYARQMLQPKVVTVGPFHYFHPAELRHRLQRSPCEGCKLNDTCDHPCQARLKWWDVQMAQLRRKYEKSTTLLQRDL